MANLLEVYDSMVKQANEAAPVQAEQDERVEVLAKYASVADELLAQEYGNDYDANDVQKLAELMINHDLEIEEQQEKVAELVQAGQILGKVAADTFKAQLQQ